MLEGFYTSLSGMLVQQRSLSVLANNITNSQTPGYKNERVVSTTFKEELMVRDHKGVKTPIGSAEPMRLVETVESNLEASSLQSTERAFDVALVGNGFFNIASGENQYMTRNGNFNIDQEGFLVLEGAGRVLGSNGEIDLQGASDFVIDYDGNVYGADGELIDKLLLTAPAEGEGLEKATNGLYNAPENAEEVAIGDVKVVQGALENANYDINREYSMIMEAQRAFQACSSALKMLDAVNQKTATQIASIG